MVKKLQDGSAKQPVRQSHRMRILNTRLGTPPKILLDMLKDHSSIVKKSLLAVPNVKKIENVSQKAAINPSKQSVKSSSTTGELSDVKPRRQHNSNKRHAASFEEMLEAGHFSKSISNEKIAETVASNESRKPETPRSSKNERMHILNKVLDNTSSKIRHSSRIRVPNSRFGYLLPGFLGQSGNGKKRGRKADILPLTPEEEKVVACDMTVKPRHSGRLRIPSKRLSFPDVYPVIRVQKKSTKARPKMEKALVKVHKCKNSSKEPASILKTRLSVKATSKNLSLSSSANRQIHSSLEVPSILYPYRPARSQALCVEPSSSITKDYISKRDVEELIAEINKALALITDEDYSELREKITHHLNNLHRENCRFRQALHQLKSELDTLSSNSAVNHYNMLIKQNSELRQQKVLADIKCETQMEEVRKLLGRIRILEMRNRNLEDFRNRLVEQKKQQHLSGGAKCPDTGLVNDLSKVETQNLTNAELDSFIMNGIDGMVKNNKSNDDKVEWGNDSWMLHC